MTDDTATPPSPHNGDILAEVRARAAAARAARDADLERRSADREERRSQPTRPREFGRDR